MLLTVLIIAFLALLTVSGVTYVLFWRNAKDTEHWEILKQESGGMPWILIARGFLSSMLAQATAFTLYPLFLVKRAWLSPGHGKPPRDVRMDCMPPVLFVHGYTHSASAWLLFAAWFRKAGYTDLHATTYNSWTMDFEDIVAHLEREAAAILEDRPGQQLVLVGHSLGGLAIRALLNTSPLRDRIMVAATMGSPHKGTTLANLGMNGLGHSLAYKGKLIRTIESTDSPPPVPVLAVYSLVDNMVMPLDGLIIEAPGWSCTRTSPVCHVGMLYHRPTADIILNFIEKAMPGPTTL